MEPLLIAVCAAFGALTGPLLARPGYRLAVEPGEPWRSACPRGHPLTGPLRGWAGLARCPGCGAFGPGPVGLALVTAACCAALAAATGPRPELAVWVVAAPVGVLAARVDVAVRRLPDVLTLPLAAWAAAGLGVAALLPGAGGSWTRALLGGAVLAAGYFVLFLISPNAMGFGDVKLALSLGVALGWYGWDVVVFGCFAGFLLAAVSALCLVIAGKAGRKTALPMGPFLVLGALGSLLLGGLAA
ncbi:A24 family peptidase [Streptomyces sp. 7-21]|uniref:prepilin peptidase n=1 Tax=Streptomyces sp. 7-21 TaxID=2802283 RepID=UPI0019202F15|nr:A24 family peptidase [Streptomyces sp. 7-21]MBL1065816.1 prepilin peptidase [Streptomyces sp. 7-21]